MKNKGKQFGAKCLRATLLASLLAFAARAQQSGTPAKPGGNGSSPLPSGAAGNPTAVASSDEVVLKVGDTRVTRSELESAVPVRPSGGGQKLSAEGRRQLAEMYVKVILLSQQAVSDHLDTSPELRVRLEMQRDRMLAQAEYDKMRGQIQVSPGEVAQYYTDHSLEFDVVQVREFLIRKRHAEEAESPGLNAEDAKAKAESIRKALASGDSPEKVAEDFAGPGVVLIDPKPRTFRRNEMVPALEKAAFEAKDGAVPEAVDTPDAVLVVDVLRRGHLEPKEAATEIEKKIRQLKEDAQIDDLKKKAGVWMDDDYFKNDAVATPALTAQPPASDPNAAPNRE